MILLQKLVENSRALLFIELALGRLDQLEFVLVAIRSRWLLAGQS